MNVLGDECPGDECRTIGFFTTGLQKTTFVFCVVLCFEKIVMSQFSSSDSRLGVCKMVLK